MSNDDPRRQLVYRGMYIKMGPPADRQMIEAYRHRFNHHEDDDEVPSLDQIRERLVALKSKVEKLRVQ